MMIKNPDHTKNGKNRTLLYDHVRGQSPKMAYLDQNLDIKSKVTIIELSMTPFWKEER